MGEVVSIFENPTADRQALDSIKTSTLLAVSEGRWALMIETDLAPARFRKFYLVLRCLDESGTMKIAEPESITREGSSSLLLHFDNFVPFRQNGGAIDNSTQAGYYLKTCSDEWLKLKVA
jgi:hypothetical protein